MGLLPPALEVEHRHSTALAAYTWEKKEEGKVPEVSWKVLEKAAPYHPAKASCKLCSAEKTTILLAEPEATLNKRGELMSKCRHRTKFLLSNVERTPD